ncbi:hypothetical protein BURMUCGD2M_0054 [Burkholderia multivorans CGD2M]|uniref:Uncharacterized protein n=1 Tax=Burkholderia multivorans CGD2 TaxID=513052 RepID=B9BZG9_9BURK|nr:hypothetical protein BURMUCGD2_0054 [Burkholderia multivorans CGD2]EEE10385.1 hypothetical protein BURMUCGD2M_0054 [Burkholderia multivorans CGD2M]
MLLCAPSWHFSALLGAHAPLTETARAPRLPRGLGVSLTDQ